MVIISTKVLPCVSSNQLLKTMSLRYIVLYIHDLLFFLTFCFFTPLPPPLSSSVPLSFAYIKTNITISKLFSFLIPFPRFCYLPPFHFIPLFPLKNRQKKLCICGEGGLFLSRLRTFFFLLFFSHRVIVCHVGLRFIYFFEMMKQVVDERKRKRKKEKKLGSWLWWIFSFIFEFRFIPYSPYKYHEVVVAIIKGHAGTSTGTGTGTRLHAAKFQERRKFNCLEQPVFLFFFFFFIFITILFFCAFG